MKVGVSWGRKAAKDELGCPISLSHPIPEPSLGQDGIMSQLGRAEGRQG